jgi:hypothetical protein
MNIRNTGCGLFFLLLLAIACQKEDAKPPDRLEPTGLLGEWVLQKTAVNGIQDLAAPLNDHFMTLEPDEDPGDFRGRFHSRSPWHNNTGTFELWEAEQELMIRYGDTEQVFSYSRSSEDLLSLTREEAGDTITDSWKRVE